MRLCVRARGVRVLCVLVAALAVVHAVASTSAAAAAPVRLPLPPHVLGQSLSEALAPGAGASEAFMVSRDSVALLQDAEASSDAAVPGQDVTGVKMSVAVPLPVAAVRMKVSMDGKMFTTTTPRSIKLVGSMAVQMEVNLADVVSLHAGVTGSVLLHSREHQYAGEMLADLGRFLFAKHEDALHAYVEEFLSAVDVAVKEAAAGVDEAALWQEAAGSFGSARDAIGSASAELKAGKAAAALAKLGADAAALTDGSVAAGADALPLLLRGRVGAALVKPYESALAPVHGKLHAVLAKYAPTSRGAGGASAEADTRSGTLVVTVGEYTGLGGGADWSLFGSSAARADAYVRVVSDVDEAQTRVVTADEPAWMEELRLAVGDRAKEAGSTVTLHVMDKDVMSDDELGVFTLNLAPLAKTPNKPTRIALSASKGKGKLVVFAYWAPFTLRDAFAEIGVPNDEGIMTMGDPTTRDRVWLRRAHTHVRGRVHRKVQWEFTRNSRSFTPCADVVSTSEELAQSSFVARQLGVKLQLSPANKRLCMYLVYTNPRMPSTLDHAAHVMNALLFEQTVSAHKAVLAAVEPLFTPLRDASSAVAAVVAGSGNNKDAAAHAEEKLVALHGAMGKVAMQRADFAARVRDALASHAEWMRKEASTMRTAVAETFPKDAAAKALAEAKATTRAMTVDFAFFVHMGAEAALDDFVGLKAKVGAGKGLRGMLPEALKEYDLTVGGLTVEWDGGRVVVAALRRKFVDGSDAVVVTVDAQLPVELEGDVALGGARPKALVDAAMLVVRGAESALNEKLASGAQLMAAIGAVAGEVEKEDLEIAGVGVERTIAPGVLARFFFDTDKNGKWRHDGERAVAYVYVMDEFAGSLERVLGPAGKKGVERVLNARASIETGVWWPLLAGGRTATTANVMADVIDH